mgnify:CR=1 FL=1
MLPKLRTGQVRLIPLRFRLVKPGQSLNDEVIRTVRWSKIKLRNGDILAVASKIVSVCERRIVKLQDLSVTRRARRIARKWKMNPLLAQLVLDEADEVLGGVRGFLLTVKGGMLTANAGVDLKNSPPGTATLWPSDPDRTARSLRGALAAEYSVRVGVILVDSRVTPLRLGTTGLALGISGFFPVEDHRGKRDLYGRKILVTETNVADDVAAAAHLMMGEVTSKVGAVVIRAAPAKFDSHADSTGIKLAARRCLILSNFWSGHG